MKRILMAMVMTAVACIGCVAQIVPDSEPYTVPDSVAYTVPDSVAFTVPEGSPEGHPQPLDTVKALRTLPGTLTAEGKAATRDKSLWIPNPQRALWLAMVIPGAGQFYNRKYWKLPIVYGGFMGCIYAMSWNNMMFKDYAQAYLDISDNDPTTESYNNFLHLGRKIDDLNREQYKQVFKKRKDKYRRWRDLSFFCMIGVYAISVIDAYVDAELSVFDISKDLSMKVKPTILSNPSGDNLLYASSIGVNCSLNF